MLVSTRSSGALALAGIAKRPDEVVVDLRACARDHEPSVALVERFCGQRLDAQPGPLGEHFDLAGSQANVIAQLFRDHQSSCLINGCAHAETYHSGWGQQAGDRWMGQ